MLYPPGHYAMPSQRSNNLYLSFSLKSYFITGKKISNIYLDSDFSKRWKIRQFINNHFNVSLIPGSWVRRGHIQNVVFLSHQLFTLWGLPELNLNIPWKYNNQTRVRSFINLSYILNAWHIKKRLLKQYGNTSIPSTVRYYNNVARS